VSPAKRREFFARLAAANPQPTTELAWTTPFELLVAVILSAQATDKGVNLATAKLFPVANTPRAILDLGLDGLKQYVKTIGLYNSKAANILATCEALLSQHGGEVPRDRDALESLPGVGRKTANVVLNTVFGEPTMAVDTHIFRVSNRTGLAPGRNVREVEDRLLKAVPAEFLLNAHHWLILHGRYVCKARTPECWRCAVHDLCAFRPKTPDPAGPGVPPPRPKAPARGTRAAASGEAPAKGGTGSRGPRQARGGRPRARRTTARS
jgi:endonuclease-3